MKQIRIFLAGFALSAFVLFPAAATANDDLDVTMDILESMDDVDDDVIVMEGPDVDVVAFVEVAFVFRVLFVLVGLEVVIMREFIIEPCAAEVISGAAFVVRLAVEMPVRFTIGVFIG